MRSRRSFHVGECHAPFFHNHEQNCSNIIITNEQEGRFQYKSIWWVFIRISEKNHSVKELDPPVHPRAISLSLSLAWRCTNQMIKWSNLNHTLTLTLKISWSYLLLRAASIRVRYCHFRSASTSVPSLLTRAASRCVPSLLFLAASICVRWIVVFPSHDLLFFYSLSRLPKSGQKPPKSAKSSFSRKACMCLKPSFSVCFW